MADIKIKYPVTDTVSIVCSVAGLASSTIWEGRASTAIDNTANLDLDHLVSGMITLGTSPVAGKRVSVYAYAPSRIIGGSLLYPDSITGVDGNKTMTSANVGDAALTWLWSAYTDATSNRTFYMPPRSIAMAFGGQLPPYWGIFVTHDSGVALNATAGNHYFQYQRIQGQSV